ncbi:pyridoxal-dependent decarboxylase [Sansalvadorimonas sp. 2012CJ34-2]|uniref:Pyridoxal-dependent decarboxylase n=1 Tax=Parendozoicomonas callyspongiae TaxID=2942213 RepID=A0ABT0PKN4_9GAMM|nr:pyridoxal-dependent decarboxylase [Sansalvadorimonas sp. 2012CJ34-2]MCL6271541.1 pyridoxal-dependent decarboxylase [Sansalvadorimonas sp. 2012CJ34-2]
MQQYLDILNKAITEWTAEPRPASRLMPAHQLSEQLDISLGEDGASLKQLEQAVKDYLHFNPDVAQPDFFKLLYSGQNDPALLGDWITALSNATMHTYQVSPVATLMELELIKQWNALVGFDDGEGVMVPGASQANLIGMMLARHKACPDYKTKGPQGQTLVAYVSDQAHYSAQKAVNVLGIGTDNLIPVVSDDNGCMRPDALKSAIQKSLSLGHTPFYIGLTAGTTVVGAFDPVEECAAIARRHNLWLHIDGAWGAPVLFSENHRHLLANSHMADSVSWDAHKLMNVPITAAVILVKEKVQLSCCCSGGGGEYLFHQDENASFNLGERSIQCGRRADALKVWLSWKAIGNKGFSDKIDFLQDLKSYCVERVNQHPSLQMMAPATYLNVLFRFQPELDLSEEQLRNLNIAICKKLREDGQAYVDYARYKGRTGIRLIIANGAATQGDIDHLLENILKTGSKLISE